jgi:hypothetical protein
MITEKTYCETVLKGTFVKDAKCPGSVAASGAPQELPETQFSSNPPSLDDLRTDLVAKFNNPANFMDDAGQLGELESAAQRVRSAIGKSSTRN